jgi:hypothetical protein
MDLTRRPSFRLGAGRYEDALRAAREVRRRSQRAEKRYVKDGELYEQQRSNALRALDRNSRQVGRFRRSVIAGAV